MPYEPPPNDEDSKKYYERSEKALRNIRHDSSKSHSRPSIETSTPQRRPYNNNDGCRGKVLQFLFLAISIVSYFS